MSSTSTRAPVDQLIQFQATEIERSKSRMQAAIERAQMKPETRDHLLRNMKAVLEALKRLDALEKQ